jgi:cation diffusion facilitator family transporter
MTSPNDKQHSKQNLRAARVATAAAGRRRKTAAAALSVVSNTLLVILKLIVGIGFGSVGVISEAIHSATDLLAAAIAYLSVRASDTPPDADHPYGHGKIESISGLAEALLIYLAGGFIITQAAQKLMAPDHHAGEVGAGLAVMAFSAAINAVLSTHLRRVAQATDSLALEADARHLRADVLTSCGVFGGLLLVRFTGQAWFDPVTALLVALLILSTAFKLTRDALRPLMDASLPPEEELAIHQVLDTDTRVLGYHKLRTRKSGSQRHADVHVQIDDDCTLVQAHDLTEELEDQIRAALPAININIHIEPYYAEMRHQREVHGISDLPPSGDAPSAPDAEGPRANLSNASRDRIDGNSIEPHTGAC